MPRSVPAPGRTEDTSQASREGLGAGLGATVEAGLPGAPNRSGRGCGRARADSAHLILLPAPPHPPKCLQTLTPHSTGEEAESQSDPTRPVRTGLVSEPKLRLIHWK